MDESKARKIIKDRMERYDSIVQAARSNSMSRANLYNIINGTQTITSEVAAKFGMERIEHVSFRFVKEEGMTFHLKERNICKGCDSMQVIDKRGNCESCMEVALHAKCACGCGAYAHYDSENGLSAACELLNAIEDQDAEAEDYWYQHTFPLSITVTAEDVWAWAGTKQGIAYGGAE